LRAVVNDDGGSFLTDLGGAGGAIAGQEQGTGNREQGTEKQDAQDAGAFGRTQRRHGWEGTSRRSRVSHVPIIMKSQDPVR
jgi:hypothetical protein